MEIFCSYCKRIMPLVLSKDTGKWFMVMHAKNPKKPMIGHCDGSGREIKLDPSYVEKFDKEQLELYERIFGVKI